MSRHIKSPCDPERVDSMAAALAPSAVERCVRQSLITVGTEGGVRLSVHGHRLPSGPHTALMHYVLCRHHILASITRLIVLTRGSCLHNTEL